MKKIYSEPFCSKLTITPPEQINALAAPQMGKLSCVNMFAITPTYLMALLRTTVQRRLRREIVHIDTQDWCSTVTRLISELQRKWFARERRA